MTATRFPEARAARGMVATPHRLATEAGVAAIRAGGNAVDAAIAAAATVAVVYPHMNGLGGDNVWLIHDAAGGRLRALCGIGRAAASATIGWYAARGVSRAIPARGGLAAVTVPGAVDGWWRAHRYSVEEMGSRLPWPALLRDAIGHARDGFAPSAGQRRPPPREPDLFGDGAAPETRAALWPLYHPDALARGPLVQRDLARTLEAVRDGGADAFYRGDLGRRLAAAAAGAGSPLAFADFFEHHSEWMEPLRIPYAAGEAVSFPPPTQGMSALALLGIVAGFDLAALPEADYVHLLVEAVKLAFEDRDRYLTEPRAMRVRPEELLAPERLAAMRARISMRRATAPPAPARAGGDTIAIVTADGAGNAVALIQSLYYTFGSAVLAGDTGVVLQNRGSFFSLDPAHVNALAPLKRTMHTLIPSMYLEGGRPRFVHGTMGGEGQPQTQAALLTRVLHRGLGPQAAVEAPRWLYGRTWGTATRALSVEGRYPEELARDLAERGHEVQVGEEWDDLFGHAQCIWMDPAGAGLVGGSDPRADGAAAGL
jgi:gamma-glutamyltranspeptidase/glutathione hydrolase